mgnify:CR=1 FL=1
MKICRKAEISNIVDFLFLQLDNVTFPLKTSTIVNFFKNIYKLQIIKYSEYAAAKNTSINDVSKLFCTDNARIIFVPQDNSYYIYYNDTMPKPRCRWNIIHELAHLYLGHAITKAKASILNLDIPQDKLDEMEHEANYFTSCCVSPYVAVIGLSCYYDMYRLEGYYTILRAFFGLSKESSYYVAKKFSQLTSFGIKSIDLIPYQRYLNERISTFPKNIFTSYGLLKYQEEIPKVCTYIANKVIYQKYEIWKFTSVGDILEVMLAKTYTDWKQNSVG